MGLPTTESICGICCSIDCEGWQAISPGGPQPVLRSPHTPPHAPLSWTQNQ